MYATPAWRWSVDPDLHKGVWHRLAISGVNDNSNQESVGALRSNGLPLGGAGLAVYVNDKPDGHGG